MKKVIVLLIILVAFASFAIVKTTVPYRFTAGTAARASEVMANFDSLDFCTDRIIDTVNRLKTDFYTDSADINHLTVDTVASIDTLHGDVLKATRVRFKKNFSDTVISDTTYSIASKNIRNYSQRSNIDTINATYGNFTLFDTLRATYGKFSYWDTINATYGNFTMLDTINATYGNFTLFDTVNATYGNFTMLDTINATYGNFTLFDTINATYGNFTLFDTINATYGNFTLFDTVNATYGNFTLFDSIRTTYSYPQTLLVGNMVLMYSSQNISGDSISIISDKVSRIYLNTKNGDHGYDTLKTIAVPQNRNYVLVLSTANYNDTVLILESPYAGNIKVGNGDSRLLEIEWDNITLIYNILLERWMEAAFIKD